MQRREFLMTAGVTLAAVSVLGPGIWADDRTHAANSTGGSSPRTMAWMHGNAGGCANAIATEPVCPVWITT